MKRTWLTILLVFSLGLTTWPDGWVRAESKVEKAKKELQDIRDKKKEVQEKLADVKKNVDNQKKKLNYLEKKVYDTQKQIDQVHKKLDVLKKQLGKRETVFKKRIRRMYQRGEMGYMTALLEADSFGEFLGKFEVLRLLVKQDHKVLEDYFKTKKEYEKKTRELTQLQATQKKQVADAKAVYEDLKAEVKKNKVYLAKLEKEETLNEELIARITSQTGNFAYGGGAFAWPTASRKINSPYGYRDGGFHYGIDIDGNMGDPIYAAASGIVKENGPASGFGWWIVIDHGSGLTTVYGHMYGSTSRVRVGQRVYKGQRIASVGNNGRSSGPHLHFEARKYGRAQNPMKYY